VPQVLCTTSRLIGWNELKLLLSELRRAMDAGNAGLMKARMRNIVPEYQYEPVHADGAATDEAPTHYKLPLPGTPAITQQPGGFGVACGKYEGTASAGSAD